MSVLLLHVDNKWVPAEDFPVYRVIRCLEELARFTHKTSRQRAETELAEADALVDWDAQPMDLVREIVRMRCSADRGVQPKANSKRRNA